MSSFLDFTGLNRLVTKLKAYFMKKPTSASTSSYPLVGYDATNNVGKYNSDIKLNLQWATIDAYSWVRTYTVTNGTFKFGTLTYDSIKRYGGVTFLATTRDYQDRNLVFLLYLQRGSYSHGDTTSDIVARKIVLTGRDQGFIQYDDIEFYHDWRSNMSTDFYVKVGSSSRVTLTVLSAVENGFTISSTWSTPTTLPSGAVAFTPQIMIKGSKTGGVSDPVCGSASQPVYVDGNGQVQVCSSNMEGVESVFYTNLTSNWSRIATVTITSTDLVAFSADMSETDAGYLSLHIEFRLRKISNVMRLSATVTNMSFASNTNNTVSVGYIANGNDYSIYLKYGTTQYTGLTGRIILRYAQGIGWQRALFTTNVANMTGSENLTAGIVRTVSVS